MLNLVRNEVDVNTYITSKWTGLEAVSKITNLVALVLGPPVKGRTPALGDGWCSYWDPSFHLSYLHQGTPSPAIPALPLLSLMLVLWCSSVCLMLELMPSHGFLLRLRVPWRNGWLQEQAQSLWYFLEIAGSHGHHTRMKIQCRSSSNLVEAPFPCLEWSFTWEAGHQQTKSLGLEKKHLRGFYCSPRLPHSSVSNSSWHARILYKHASSSSPINGWGFVCFWGHDPPSKNRSPQHPVPTNLPELW